MTSHNSSKFTFNEAHLKLIRTRQNQPPKWNAMACLIEGIAQQYKLGIMIKVKRPSFTSIVAVSIVSLLLNKGLYLLQLQQNFIIFVFLFKANLAHCNKNIPMILMTSHKSSTFTCNGIH